MTDTTKTTEPVSEADIRTARALLREYAAKDLAFRVRAYRQSNSHVGSDFAERRRALRELLADLGA